MIPVNRNKGRASIWMLVSLLGILVVAEFGLGYFFIKNKEEIEKNGGLVANKYLNQKEQRENSVDRELDMITFQNQEWGISIKFPDALVPEDGIADFVWNNTRDGFIVSNAEYFHFCDGVYKPSSGEICTGPFAGFGIQLHDYVVTQVLIDSWGAEVGRSQQVTVNGKPAWAVEICAANGCSTSIMLNHPEGTLSMSFYNDLYDDNASPLFISESAKEILNTLEF